MWNRLGSALAIGTLALVLTSCSDDEPAGIGGATDDQSPTAVPGGESPDDGNTNGDDDGDNGDDAGDDAGDDSEVTFATDADCVGATWLLNNESWIDAASSSFAQGGVEVDELTGTVVLDIAADGSFETIYDEWTIHMTYTEMNGGGTIRRHGTDGGTWNINGDVLEINETSANSTVDTEFEVDGQSFTMDGIEGQANAVETFTFECDATTMMATTSDGTFAFDRQ